MEKGLFGNLFDFNRDGEMNVFERAAEFAFVEDLLEIEDKEVNGCSAGDFEDDELDFDELELMEPWERRQALEDADLDPDDYDFD